MSAATGPAPASPAKSTVVKAMVFISDFGFWLLIVVSVVSSDVETALSQTPRKLYVIADTFHPMFAPFVSGITLP